MVPKSWTIKDLLVVTSDYLKRKQIESPRLTAELLLAHQLRMDRVALYLNFDQPLTEEEIAGYRFLIKRRLGREPLQYITGTQEFWSLQFMVGPEVLIPRPESELLVELAVNRATSEMNAIDHPLRILDLGTGCGALAISLSKEMKEARVWASDISSPALHVAGHNAERHSLSEKIHWLQGDLWDPIEKEGLSFDLIVSNPPYVASEEFHRLPPEIRDHEPRAALDGGKNGMYFVQKIFSQAPDFMNPGAWIIVEMAPEQTLKALKVIDAVKGYDEKLRIKDYSRRYRVVMARKSGSVRS